MLGKSNRIEDFRRISNIQDLPTIKTQNHRHVILFEKIGDKLKQKKNTATGKNELQMSLRHF